MWLMKKTIRTKHAPKYPARISQFLKTIPSEEVVSSLYYTGRLLQRRRDVADIRQGFRIAGVQGEPTDEDEKLPSNSLLKSSKWSDALCNC